jgi:hypothetical protein
MFKHPRQTTTTMAATTTTTTTTYITQEFDVPDK